MSKKDKKKELLAEIRRWQSYFVTTLIAIVASFTITQYDSISNILLFSSIVGVIILLVLIATLAVKIKKSLMK